MVVFALELLFCFLGHGWNLQLLLPREYWFNETGVKICCSDISWASFLFSWSWTKNHFKAKWGIFLKGSICSWTSFFIFWAWPKMAKKLFTNFFLTIFGTFFSNGFCSHGFILWPNGLKNVICCSNCSWASFLFSGSWAKNG